MKKLLTILLVILIPLIVSSQEIISRNSLLNEQGEIDTLKVVNIIFAEHEKLSIENPLLKEKIKSLEELNNLYCESDSLLKKEAEILKEKVAQDSKQIKKLKSSRKRIIGFSCVGGIVLFILGIIL